MFAQFNDMAKMGGALTWLLGGAVLGAGALYLFEHLKSFNISGQIAPPATKQANVSYANVGILPGNELPLFDYMDDSAPRGTSNVWDRRTTVYRNDGVLYNTVGAPIFYDGTTDWDANKSLTFAGAYTNGLEDGPRPRQEHAGGAFPGSLQSTNYPF